MGHIHAKEMAEYAKDALETDKPWERWQVSFSDGFIDLDGHPNWVANHEYRRKPKVILINGYEVPEPHRTPLEIGCKYWTITFIEGAVDFYWDDDKHDHKVLKNGFVHLAKEAAEKHYEALKSFTFKEGSSEHI